MARVDGASRWKNQQIDAALFSFGFHFRSHRKFSIDSGTNNQTRHFHGMSSSNDTGVWP